MTPEWKTLKQLWNENGQKPFDAICPQGTVFHCEALCPTRHAIGWLIDGRGLYYDMESVFWKLHKTKKKITLYPLLKFHKESGNYSITSELFRDANDYARWAFDGTPVRLLLDRGVEIEVEE